MSFHGFREGIARKHSGTPTTLRMVRRLEGVCMAYTAERLRATNAQAQTKIVRVHVASSLKRTFNGHI